jgi:ferritin-like metal-binding protein YciE
MPEDRLGVNKTKPLNSTEKEDNMPVKNPKELFVMLLSDVRQATERGEKIYDEIGQLAQDPDVKEALEAREFVSEKDLATLDQCFKLIGEQPVKLSGRLQEAFVEDFRKELAEIQSPVAKRLFVLVKLNHLTNLRIGEYMALIAAADVAGNHGVGLLLETCLADKLAFVERTRRWIRNEIETKVAERRAASA